MEELYSIMRGLLEVEYNQKSLLYVLNSLEASYDEKTSIETRLISNCIKYYLNALQSEITIIIERFDNYTIDRIKNS